MSDRACFRRGGSLNQCADLAESVVMQAYLQLPLLPRQPDGCWVAPLTRIDDREVRLIESVPASAQQAVLRVEVFDRSTHRVIESRYCAEVEDAVTAYREMITPTQLP